MISLPDTDVRESRGNRTHRSDCHCPPCAQQREHARKLAEQAALVASYGAQHRAAMRAVAAVAARLTGLPAPDAIRVLTGSGQDAVAICEAAGMSPGQIRARWSDAAPSAPAQSSSGFWAQFPEHDPAFLSGQRSLEDVTAQYRARAGQKAARRESSVLWHTRDGVAVTDGTAAPMGASTGPSGEPVQRTVVHRDAPEPGSETV